jgi:hypothetical protein
VSGGTPRIDPVAIALRAYTEPVNARESQSKRGRRPATTPRRDGPHRVVIVDFETTVTAEQRLTFGWGALYEECVSRGGILTLRPIDEVLCVASDLAQRNPDGYANLVRYARHSRPNVDTSHAVAPASIRLLDEHELRGWIHQHCILGGATLCGFNINFDMSRLAVKWGATSSPRYAGGFYLAIFTLSDGITENRYRPHLAIKNLGNKRALRGWLKPYKPPKNPKGSKPQPFNPGDILDLRQLVFGYTDRGHTLRSAGEALRHMGHRVEHLKHDADEHGKITLAYIDYARQDVRASASLYEAAMTEHRRHPLTGRNTKPVQASQITSPASVAKGYLRAMGVKPILAKNPEFARKLLGQGASAYFGGRSGVGVRGRVPVVYLDAASMYPTVNARMRTWRLIISRRIEPRDVTSEVRQLVRQSTLDAWLQPDHWPDLVTLVKVKPTHRNLFPERGRHGENRSWTIGVNPITSDAPLWYALSDVIASKLLTGHTPRILKAIRLEPIGVQRGLRPVKLRGEVSLDPREDFFVATVEARRRLDDTKGPAGLALKCVGNSIYGITAETRVEDLVGENTTRPLTVWDHTGKPRVIDAHSPESPGEFAFPPLAACITSAARLMLALLEALVTQYGGAWAATDTDSMMLIASEHGGLYPCRGGPEHNPDGVDCVRALTRAQVEQIQRRFDDLNPYDRKLVPDLIEAEPENYDADGRQRQLWFHGISAKRYVLTNDGGELLKIVDEPDDEATPASEDAPPAELDGNTAPDIIRKASEHGLGLYINPVAAVKAGERCPKCGRTAASAAEHEPCRRALFVEQSWRYITNHIEPDWLDQMAVSRTAITTPELMKRFDDHNKRVPSHERIRPFGFVLVAHPADRVYLDNPERFLLVAPYETDPRLLPGLDWRNVYDPHRKQWHPYTVRPGDPPREVVRDGDIHVKTFRDVLDDYRDHPEPKSLGPDGLPCHRETLGLLRRRPITVAGTPHTIGKEGHGLDAAVELGRAPTVADLTDTDPAWQLTLQAARHGVSLKTLARAATDRHTLKRALDGHPLRPDTHDRIILAVSLHARTQLRSASIRPPIEREALLATYIVHTDGGRICPGCGQPLPSDADPRRRYHNDACRKQAQRDLRARST